MFRFLLLALALGASAKMLDVDKTHPDVSGTKKDCEECVTAEENLISAIEAHDAAEAALATATKNWGDQGEVEKGELKALNGMITDTSNAKTAVGAVLGRIEGWHGGDDPKSIMGETSMLNTKAKEWKDAMAAQATQQGVYDGAKKKTADLDTVRAGKLTDVNSLVAPLNSARATATRECAGIGGRASLPKLGSWDLAVKGTKYTHTWKTTNLPGTSNAIFRTRSVNSQTEGQQAHCVTKYNIQNSGILEQSEDKGVTWKFVTQLSCANQGWVIHSKVFHPAA